MPKGRAVIGAAFVFSAKNFAIVCVLMHNKAKLYKEKILCSD